LSPELQQEFKGELAWLEEFIRRHLASLPWSEQAGSQRLRTAMEYALFSGGKRFRPLMTLMMSKALGDDADRGIAWAAAVEFVHTYSLVHDDLPCMDDDDLRRGQPTTHRKFDEATALLAGDALLTEAFGILSLHYHAKPHVLVALVRELSRASGPVGMVEGQMLDLFFQRSSASGVEIEALHRRKTGELIKASVMGAAWIAGVDDEMLDRVHRLGALVGLAFQIADDLEDVASPSEGEVNLVTVCGRENALRRLRELTQMALDILSHFGAPGESLCRLVRFNSERVSVTS
jgi:geranylgeranyl diphosphate synthase type II